MVANVGFAFVLLAIPSIPLWAWRMKLYKIAIVKIEFIYNLKLNAQNFVSLVKKRPLLSEQADLAASKGVHCASMQPYGELLPSWFVFFFCALRPLLAETNDVLSTNGPAT